MVLCYLLGIADSILSDVHYTFGIIVWLELLATNLCSGIELHSHEGKFGRPVLPTKKVGRRYQISIQRCSRFMEIKHIATKQG